LQASIIVNIGDMERDRHLLQEKSICDMVSEPTAAAYSASPSYICGNDYQITSGVPQSVNEALADIEEGEREFERMETFSHREVMQMVWGKIDNYAGKIQ
jgi:predicted transcriptional regulator